jgi:sRNA-binding carbon storage regulator CsrA
VLVLRRRPNEAIVFDGGLVLTLTQVSGRSAWLAFSHPALESAIELSVPAHASQRAELAIRGVRSFAREDLTSTVELATSEDGDPEAVLSFTRAPGDEIVVGPLRFALSAIEEERVYLELHAECLAAPVTLSIVTVSTVDARIGVNAPPELRVYRREVWDEMQAANTAAAGEWSKEDLAALSTDKP